MSARSSPSPRFLGVLDRLATSCSACWAGIPAAAARAVAVAGRGAPGGRLHRLRRAAALLQRPDRRRPGAGAGVPGGAGPGSAVRRGRGRLHRAPGRGPRSVDFRADAARPGATGRADAADGAGPPRRPGGRDPGAAGRGRRSGDRAARRADRRRRHRGDRAFDRRSIGIDRRVAADRQGAGRCGLHRHDEPVRRDRGRHREGRRRDDVRPGAQPGVPGAAAQGAAGEDGRPPGAVLPARGRGGRRRDAPDRLSRRLARRLVADGRRAGGRVPVRPGPGDPGGDARQHGLAGAARRLDQGGVGAREPGNVRHVRLRQDRDADQGMPQFTSLVADRRPRRGRGAAPGGLRRGRQPPSAGRGRGRGSPAPVA